jgi:hypothetical protein
VLPEEKPVISATAAGPTNAPPNESPPGRAAPEPFEQPDPVGTRVEGCRLPWTLLGLFRTYRWRLLFTYGLFNLENLVHLAQPFVLGLAINDLLKHSFRGLLLFVGQHVLYVLLSALRRMYDTRAFTRVYTDLASQLVFDQRRHHVAVSRVAARSALSRELVDFFERDVPVVVHVLYSVAGALVMLAFYDWLLTPLCLALLAPLWLLNGVYGRKTFRLNGRLNDQLEREVEVIDRARPAEVQVHYSLLACLRVKLSDWEVYNFSLMELFVLGLMAATLARTCMMPGTDAGSIFAVFRYVLMFVCGLDSVPILVQQLSRLRDISKRMQLPAAPGSASGPAPG